MRRGNLPSAPNYTNAALVMGVVNIFWVLLVIWASYGLLITLTICYVLDRLIVNFGRRS